MSEETIKTVDSTATDTPEPIEYFGFVDDESVKNVSLAFLKQSIRVEGKHGRVLQSRPVQSWDAIEFMLGILEAANVNYQLESMYVQKRNSFPMLTDQEKALGYNRANTPIRKWLFDKVLACIQIPNVGNDLVNGRIGFGFNDDGIEVAFGMHVNVCQNFNILGGNIMRTYKWNGRDPISWEGIEYQFRDWVTSIDQKMKIEMELMKRMQEATFLDNELNRRTIVNRIIGNLYTKAIDQAYVSKQPAPFDTASMSLLTQNILRRPAGNITNVWDLYNYGTNVMKPANMDIADIHSSSALFADYLINEFEIKRN